MALTKWSDNIAAAALQGNYDGYIQSSLLQLRLTSAIGSNPANGTAVYNITENTTYKVHLYMDTRFRVAACSSIAMNTVMTNYYRDAADKSDTTVTGAYKETEITSEAGQVYMPVVYWASGGSKTWSEVYDTIEVRKQLTGTLELTTPPVKTQYNVGEELDLTGMVVSVVWSDGTKEAVTDYTVSGYDSSTAGDKTITVSYQDFTATFMVTVAEKEVTVTGIRITHTPDIVRYETGADFDATGLEVTADLSDGSTQVVTDYTLSGYDSATSGTKTITATYQGHTATFVVTVYELSSIAITTPPAKVQYNVGDTLNLTSMVVTATYSDGVTGVVTDYTTSGFDSSKAGTCTVTVAYQGASASFDVTVAKASVPGITLESLLNTTEGMDVIRNNSKNDDGTDTVTGVDWFTYAGNVCNNIYVSGNNWIGFGTSTEHLKICRRDGAVYYVYRQEGNLDGGTKFLKIRVEGYTYYSGTTDAYKLIYELFLFDDGCLYINVVQSPTNSSYIGTSSITDGTNTATLNIPVGVTAAAPVEITVEGAGSAQTIYYEKYPHLVPVGIEVTSIPEKTVYYGNELFDSTGLVVSVVDAAGRKKAISDYSLSGFDSSIAGTKTITAAKDTFTATFDVTIRDISITGIEVTSPPTKTEYNLEEEFNGDGLVVSLIISDGEKIVTEAYQIVGFDTTSSGEKTIRVVYGDFSDDFIITVLAEIVEYIGSPNLEDVAAVLNIDTWVMTISGTGAIKDFPSNSPILKDYKADIKSVVISAGVTNIGENAFEDYSGLVDLSISDSVTKIGSFAFFCCEKLNNVILPNALESMGGCAFFGCASLTKIDIPDSITVLEYEVFEDCSSLENVNIPVSVTIIDMWAFSGCTALRNLEIPGAVVEICEKAFRGCGNLEITIRHSMCVIYDSQETLEVKKIIGYIGSTANTYADKYGRVFVPLDILQGIQISSLPGKLQYITGEALDTSGMVVTARYDTGYTGEITNYTLSGFDSTTEGGKTITVTYQGFTATFEVVVYALSSITITVLPTKTEYNVGDSLDLTGMVVTATYGNGPTKTVADYTVSGFDNTAHGAQTITVTYQGFSDTFQVTVYGAVTGIRIAHYPDKVYYKLNDTLDTTGLQVVAVTEGGLERPVTDYTLSALDSSTTGSKQITVTYEVPVSADTNAAYFAGFRVKVTATGDNPFDDNTVTYKRTVHWPNGEFADIGDEDLTGAITLQESICSNNYFIFGGCICNQISFTTHSKQFMSADEDATPHGDIEVYVESKGTKVKLFTGTIDSGKRTAGLTQRNIIAYDYLYKFRNTDIAWWYKNKTADKNMILTQKQFRDQLFDYLGIEQVPAKLYYDDALVPDTNQANEINVANVLKDLCLQNSVFGWMNRDGAFEYMHLPENSRAKSMDNAGNIKYAYYDAQVYVDTYESCDFTEGRIWYPKEFLSDPPVGMFTPGGLTAQEAYEANVYYNRNSFFVGDSDWLDSAFQGDEYGAYTRMEPIFPICYGTTSKTDNQHLYRAQGYTLTLRGNPLNKVGDSIEITVRKTAADGTQLEWVIHSYIMSRTLKLTGDTSMTDVYSAKNGPYNGNDSQAGNNTAEHSAELFRLRSEGPTISYAPFTDGVSTLAAGDAKKDRLRCVKSLTEAEYTALQTAGSLRTDTLYFIKE